MNLRDPVLCSSYKVFRIRKSIYRDSELVSVWGWGWKQGRKVTAGGRGFLLGRLKWSKVRWLHNPVNTLKTTTTTKLCALCKNYMVCELYLKKKNLFKINTMLHMSTSSLSSCSWPLPHQESWAVTCSEMLFSCHLLLEAESVSLYALSPTQLLALRSHPAIYWTEMTGVWQVV